MENMKPEVIVIKDEDSDDNHVIDTPTKTYKKWHKKEPKKKERKVERAIDISSNTETLVVTQKVRKRKQKIQCIINLTNICEHRDKQKQKVKTSSTAKVNSNRPVKVDKAVPVCLRTRCRSDLNRKYDNKRETLKREPRKVLERRKSNEPDRRGKLNVSLDRKNIKDNLNRKYDNKALKREPRKGLDRKKSNEPDRRGKLNVSLDRKNIKDKCGRSKSGQCNSFSQLRVSQRRRSPSHTRTRYLSPVSSASLSDVLSECDEGVMSYEDISSDSTTEIDTLIKRTKDRERIQYNKDDIYKHHKLDHKQPSNLWSNNYDDLAKNTEKLEKLNYLQSLQKTDLQFHKSKNDFKAVNDRPKYDYTFDRASLSLTNPDKPSHDNEQIHDQYKPMHTTTPKLDDIFDASATDDGTVLTGEMDIVSFHSEGTLVLNVLYSPTHSTESRSVKSDAYSPTVSPAFFYHQGGIENTSHCVPTPLISPAFTPLFQNVFDYPSPKEVDNDEDTSESKIKQEQNISPKAIEQPISENNVAKSNASIVSNNLESKDIKVKFEYDPGNDNNKTTFDSKFNDVTDIKEEIDEDSMNNNIKLQPPSMSLYWH